MGRINAPQRLLRQHGARETTVERGIPATPTKTHRKAEVYFSDWGGTPPNSHTHITKHHSRRAGSRNEKKDGYKTGKLPGYTGGHAVLTRCWGVWPRSRHHVRWYVLSFVLPNLTGVGCVRHQSFWYSFTFSPRMWVLTDFGEVITTDLSFFRITLR